MHHTRHNLTLLTAELKRTAFYNYSQADQREKTFMKTVMDEKTELQDQ